MAMELLTPTTPQCYQYNQGSYPDMPPPPGARRFGANYRTAEELTENELDLIAFSPLMLDDDHHGHECSMLNLKPRCNMQGYDGCDSKQLLAPFQRSLVTPKREDESMPNSSDCDLDTLSNSNVKNAEPIVSEKPVAAVVPIPRRGSIQKLEGLFGEEHKQLSGLPMPSLDMSMHSVGSCNFQSLDVSSHSVSRNFARRVRFERYAR